MAPSSTMGAVIPLNLKCANEGGGLPVPMGDRRPAPMAAQSPACSVAPSWWMRRSRRRRRACQGRERVGLRTRLAGAAADQVVAARWRAPIFLKVMPRRWKKRHTGALGDPQPMLALQVGRDLRQHHVRGLFDQRQDRLGPCLDPLRAPVAALRSGPTAARSDCQARTHLIAVEGAMPKRLAAPRRDIPSSTAVTTRRRRSSERGRVRQAGLLHQPVS